MKIEIEKPVVSKWFDEWYKAMKYAEHRDAFILKVVSAVNQYDGYCDYSRDNVFFQKDKFTYISENFTNVINAVQFGYEVEPDPLYYAKIKGWKHIGTSSYYFGLEEDLEILEVTILENNYRYAFALTKEHWNKLGINDSNADFEGVKE